MGRKRRSFTPEFKARVALDALKERETLAQLASKYDVHPNQISQWKKELLQNASGLFNGSCGKRKDDKEAKEQARLFEKIGRIEVENDWLRKKLEPYQ